MRLRCLIVSFTGSKVRFVLTFLAIGLGFCEGLLCGIVVFEQCGVLLCGTWRFAKHSSKRVQQ